jgi:hypothetical protein
MSLDMQGGGATGPASLWRPSRAMAGPYAAGEEEAEVMVEQGSRRK